MTLKAMVSSTMLDLPEHRKEVMDACLRQDFFPLMMEHLPAADADAIRESLRLVDQADVYIGIFAHRYGHRPKGRTVSIVELEYDRAVERGIPRLLFVMADEHLILARDVECSQRRKLDALKRRFDNVYAAFHSPVDLRAHVIDSLSKLARR